MVVAITRSGSVAHSATRGAPAARSISLPQARSAVRRAQRALFATTVTKMVQTRAVAFDDQAKDFIDNFEMKRVTLRLKRLLKRKIDILGFDGCLMSMVEIGYEIRDAAAFTVGSQEEEPNNVWPYDRILAALAKKPVTTPAELARAMVDYYLASRLGLQGVQRRAVARHFDLFPEEDSLSSVCESRFREEGQMGDVHRR